MNYDDLYILSQIRRFNERLALIETKIGSLINQITNITNTTIRYGSSAPNTPADPTLPSVYYDYTNYTWYFWDTTNQSWIIIDPAVWLGMYVVPTIVELRQVGTLTAPLSWARTLGNLVTYDGQGSEYSWDADSTDADDGMSTILPDDRTISDSGRWKQITSS